MSEISLDDFLKVEIVTGTIVEAALHSRAKKPAYILKIDFGELGFKTSSAQLTENYTPENLIGKQIVAVMNFPLKRVAGVVSEVLVLAAVSPLKGTVVLESGMSVENGVRIF